MKLDDLLKLAHEVAAEHDRRIGDIDTWSRIEAFRTMEALARDVLKTRTQLATAISNLLTAETCGWPRPEAVGGQVLIPVGWSSDLGPMPVSPADARVMAVMLLNAASEAEEGSK